MNLVMMLLAVVLTGAQAAPTQAPKIGGKKIFTAKCAVCHGADAKGKSSMASAFGVKVELMNLTTALRDKTDADVAKIVTDGLNGKMPSFKGKLDEAQTKDVVAYVRSLGPKPETKADKMPAAEKPAAEKPAGKN